MRVAANSGRAFWGLDENENRAVAVARLRMRRSVFSCKGEQINPRKHGVLERKVGHRRRYEAIYSIPRSNQDLFLVKPIGGPLVIHEMRRS